MISNCWWWALEAFTRKGTASTTALRRANPAFTNKLFLFPAWREQPLGPGRSFAALLHEVAHRVRQLAVVPLQPEIVEKCGFRRWILLEN
jgi:hypothetical protein